MQAFKIEKGKRFRFQNDVYQVHRIPVSDNGHVLDTIEVIRIAGLWPKESNPLLEEDTWIPTHSKQIERFNSYCNVIPVTCKIYCTVTEIK